MHTCEFCSHDPACFLEDQSLSKYRTILHHLWFLELLNSWLCILFTACQCSDLSCPQMSRSSFCPRTPHHSTGSWKHWLKMFSASPTPLIVFFLHCSWGFNVFKLPIWEIIVCIICVHQQWCYCSGRLLTGLHVWNMNNTRYMQKILHKHSLFKQKMLCNLKK